MYNQIRPEIYLSEQDIAIVIAWRRSSILGFRVLHHGGPFVTKGAFARPTA
jgi:hypothetical protein